MASTTFHSTELEVFAGQVGPPEAGPVVVEGKRTRWSIGGEPDPGARVLQAPSGIVDYTPAEMTVTVRAGTPVTELNEALAECGQRCALPDHGGTVGGALAVGEDTINAVGRGRVRSSVLQIRYISAEGKIITSGGPTVKNVTGFDLPRLMVGSLGTLGCLAEATLRTNPIPPVSRWLHAGGVDPAAVAAALYRPSALLYHTGHVWVLLEGHEVDVEAELAVLAEIGEFTPAPPPPLPRNRWSFTPAEVLTLGSGARAEETGPWVASVLTGTVYAANPAPPRPVSDEVGAVEARLKALFDPTGRLNPGRSPAFQTPAAKEN